MVVYTSHPHMQGPPSFARNLRSRPIVLDDEDEQEDVENEEDVDTSSQEEEDELHDTTNKVLVVHSRTYVAGTAHTYSLNPTQRKRAGDRERKMSTRVGVRLFQRWFCIFST